jgi:release factor glutamine methyltransferase
MTTMNAAQNSISPTVRETLGEAATLLAGAGIESARLDVELLLAEVLGVERSKLYLNREASLDPRARERFNSLVSRRMRGEPVAYIAGRREFWSLDFLVTPAVLVPRPETELLVEVAVGLFEAESHISDRKFQILDLGTGSGAIAISLAKEIAAAEMWATDISLEALEIARANARRHGVDARINFFSGDLFAPVEDRGEFFHLIVSNPPYVRRDAFAALPRDVREFEPRVALDGGADGLDFYRRIISQAPRCLAAGGFVALEIGADMGEAVARLLAGAGCFTAARIERDNSGRDRVVVAQARLASTGRTRG